MTTILIIIAIYLVGVVLAFGRANASFAAIDLAYIIVKPSQPDGMVIFLSLTSWLGVLVGVVAYFAIDNEARFAPYRRFLRFSNKDIWDAHYQEVENWKAEIAAEIDAEIAKRLATHRGQ